jgi:5-(carboxyamino)imidazole ribonucleotide synthase
MQPVRVENPTSGHAPASATQAAAMPEQPPTPPRRPSVAMVGAGQLARMSWQAAISLDIALACLGGPEDAAGRAGVEIVEGSARDASALRALADRGQVLTYEHELLELDALAELEAGGVVARPSSRLLRLAVDKLHQRRTLSTWGIAVPDFTPAPDAAAVERFARQRRWPVVLKARSGGYDGRGVWVCENMPAVEAAFDQAKRGDLELYVEECVRLKNELAVIVARSAGGETAVYEPVDTHQENGMCHEVVLPTSVERDVAHRARELAVQIAERGELEGLMAVELFLDESDNLLVNELALRAHNTGHIHTEASGVSQFEQHLRAILNLPLGDPATTAPAAAMVNIIGPADGSDPAHRLAAGLQVRDAHVHLYGKSARPGRKLGHVTVCASTPEEALRRARLAVDRLHGDV